MTFGHQIFIMTMGMRANLHPPAGLQTAIGYIHVQRGQVAQPPKDSGSSISQDVRIMDSSTIPVALEVPPTQVAFINGQGRWPPQANSITYELRSLEREVVHEAPALAMTTRIMRSNMSVEVDAEEEEIFFWGDVPYFLDLENVAREARKATKALERG